MIYLIGIPALAICALALIAPGWLLGEGLARLWIRFCKRKE